MPRIILRFIRTPGFITSGICWDTNSRFDHAEFGVEQNGLITGWLGAHAWHGVQLRAPDYCKPTFERRYAIPVTQNQYDAWHKYAFGAIGTGYNFKDILGLLIHARGMSSPHKLICSQFCIDGMYAAGIVMLNVLPARTYLVTPEMLHLSTVLIGRGMPPAPYA